MVWFRQHHDLSDHFVEIVTNPAHFEPSGLLHLERRVKLGEEQHGCQVGCSGNMCKGEICFPLWREMQKVETDVANRPGKELDEFMARHGGWDKFDRVVYVGDGGNDFCPVLRLRSFVLRPLSSLKLTHSRLLITITGKM